ncbi:MAG: CHAT domain-containing protein [Pseudomonadota bacterium]
MKNAARLLLLVGLLGLSSCGDEYYLRSAESMLEAQSGPFEGAYARAERAKRNGDVKAAIAHWRELLPLYKDGSWLLSEANIYNNIAILQVESQFIGEVPETARLLEDRLAKIDKIGLENVDDMGRGFRASVIPGNNRKWQYDNLKNSPDHRLLTYYKKVGDREKLEVIGKKILSQAQAEKGKINSEGGGIKKTGETAITAKEASPAGEAGVKKNSEKATVAKDVGKENKIQTPEEKIRSNADNYSNTLKEFERKIQEAGSELKNRYALGDTDLEKQIDTFVTLQKDAAFFNFMPDAFGPDLSQVGLESLRADGAALKKYFGDHFLASWGLALKAAVLFQVGRINDAKTTLQQADALRAAMPRIPVSKKNTDAYPIQIKKIEGADYLSWEIFRALILSKMDDPQVVEVWRTVINEMRKREDNRGDKTISSIFTYHQVYKEKLTEIVTSEAVKDLKRFNRPDIALPFIDVLLKNKESARSSISSESDKRGYLVQNLALYNTYIELSQNVPGENLYGIERAKSRAMLDLMGGGMKSINNVKVNEVKELQGAAAAQATGDNTESKTRGIKVLEKKLQDLKQSYPEYYTLVTSDVAKADDLLSFLRDNEVAVSYYSTQDNLFINLLGAPSKEKSQSAGGKIEKVITVPISQSSLYASIQNHRQQLQNQVAHTANQQGTVSFTCRVINDEVTYFMDNKSPLPVKIHDIVTRSGRRSLNLATYELELLPLPQIHSYNTIVESLTDQVLPGKSAVLFKHAIASTTGNAPKVGENTIVIRTNLGELQSEFLYKADASGRMQPEIKNSRPITVDGIDRPLYSILIKPIEEFIVGRKLIIIPHGVLHSIPFETLLDEQGHYLVEKNTISYAPSLNVLGLAKKREKGSMAKLVAFGDTLGDLQFARNEVEVIRKNFRDSVMLFGDQVSGDSVRNTISQGDVVHFACHGVFNSDSPLDSGLVMSPGVGQTTSVRGAADLQNFPLFKVSDIMGLKINANLVFLSACDTAKSAVTGGDEIIGLTRSFFVAGASSVINTLWAIDDKSTALLAEQFYTNIFQKNMDKASALRNAKLHLMENGYKEPHYWGAFVLQGN